MRLDITHQDRYSRGQLLLRFFFGWLYIGIPHGFLLLFVGLWSQVLAFVTFWIVLFTGRFPESIFEWQIGYQRWSWRLSAVLGNLIDGYPAFGVNGSSESATLEIPRPEKVNRGLVILRVLFGWAYVLIPHGVCLVVRSIGTAVLMFLAWWAVLFTGKYPERWHGFNVGTMRWSTRIGLYLGYFTDEYPRFSGKP